MEKFLYGKKVLVTGSGSGIGYETARLFAGYGYTVYGVARSVEEKEEDIGKGKLVSLKMDVTDEESIKRVLVRTVILNFKYFYFIYLCLVYSF